MRSASAILGAALLMLAAPALAGGPAVIAHGPSGAPPSSEPPAPLPADGVGVFDDGPEVRLGPCGPQAIDAEGRPDRSPHGWVDVAVGTNGYRHGAAHVCKPLGDNGAVAITVGGTQGGFRR